MNSATLMFTRPMKNGDPTQYTYIWAEKAIKIARDLGYNSLIDIQKEDTTFDNVSKKLKENKVRIYSHYGHGCPASLQGNKECVVARKYTVDELICMMESPNIEEHQKLLKLIRPLGELSCPGICSLDIDPCSPLCTYDTNVNLLKGSIVFAVACHSASQLGKCAIAYRVETYIGYDELLMFPVDSLNSQDMFGEVQIKFFKELLMGHTVAEAEAKTNELEDSYIRRFKKTKYIALPMLWNRIHRKILGNRNAMIYE